MELRRQKKELAKRKRQIEKVSLQMIQTLSTTIEAKDEYARGHSHRVAEYAALIAGELGWNSEEIMNLKYAAHLHDIGKIGIPDMLLNKPARLTPEEYSVIKEHTVIGAEILKNITLIPHVAEVARSHHEHYDGTGYPDGLAGEDIPLSARIVAIADSYDAMNSKRIYRNALPPEKIFEEIQNNRGLQFVQILQISSWNCFSMTESISVNTVNSQRMILNFHLLKMRLKISFLMLCLRYRHRKTVKALTSSPGFRAGAEVKSLLHNSCSNIADASSS